MADSRGNGRIDIAPLRQDQYQQVAEWEHGPQEDADWVAYAAEMSQPQWRRFGLYLQGELIGCLSIEQVGRNMAAYHVATARRKIHPRALADVLVNTAAYLFAQDFTALVARIPRERRAAARLAIRCGMKEWGHTDKERYFMMTKRRYHKYANA